MKLILSAIVGLFLLLYPVIIYYGLSEFEPRYVAIVVMAIVLLRLVISRELSKKMPWMLPSTIAGVGCLALTIIFEQQFGILFYPVAISSVMLVTFAGSLIKGPSVIETFARLTEPNLDAHGVRYTRKVTIVWCMFFIINASIALYTALFASLADWTLYNGFISYILMGSLMGGEFIVRHIVRRKNKLND
ncbi:MAG: hypothetical protein HRU23_02620 [Gammaproteobacteria bacterium]|nr:hypothetical protein [Gammaproteobacteria bacterium]